jgi:hypothetical protein
MNDVFAIQNEIARLIAQRFQVSFERRQSPPLVTAGTHAVRALLP